MRHRQNVAIERPVPFAAAVLSCRGGGRAQTGIGCDKREHMPSRPSFADDRWWGVRHSRQPQAARNLQHSGV